jgi:hypothetical protein
MGIYRTDAKGVLENAQTQLAELIRQRDQLNMSIIQAQHNVQALSAVVWREELTRNQNDVQAAVVGLSDAIRSVLRLQKQAMTAAQVKGSLDMMGYNFAGLNPSALVHNTLKRMAGTGELGYNSSNKTYQAPPPGFVPMNVDGTTYRKR